MPVGSILGCILDPAKVKVISNWPVPVTQKCSPTVPALRCVMLWECFWNAKGMEGSPGQTPAALEELCLASGNYFNNLEDDFSLFLPSPLVPPSSVFPVPLLFPPSAEIPVSPEFLPSHPLLPRLPNSASSSAPTPRVPFSPVTSLLTLCGSTSSLPVSSSTQSRGSPGSAFSH